MYVRVPRLGEITPEPAPVIAPVSRFATSNTAVRQQEGYAAILASRWGAPSPGVSWGAARTVAPVAPSITAQQRAQAAIAAQQRTRVIAPVRATEISFYDEARRTKIEQLKVPTNGVVDQNTPDVYAVEAESLPAANDFTPYESISRGDRAIVSAPVNPETQTAAASLIPLALAALFLFGG